MSEKPEVSVIIPVYNAEKYLNDCIGSVINQTLKNIEIICVDDGSTDSSLEILKGFEAADSRIRVIHQENKNAGAARNNGMQYATGEYYSFLDADDFFEPDMLEKVYNRAVKINADMVIFSCDNYFESTGKYMPRPDAITMENMPDKETFTAMEIRNPFCSIVGWAWNKLFSADFIKSLDISFMEQRNSNDVFFVFSAYAAARRITILNEILVHYRRTATSLNSTRENSWMCFMNAMEKFKEQLVRWNLYENYERAFINRIVHAAVTQIVSLPWPSQELLFNVLKNSWFEKMGVTDKPAGYFYDAAEYEAYKKIMTGTCEEVYPGKSRFLEAQNSLIKENNELKQKCAELENSRSYRIGRLVTFPVRKIKKLFGK